MVKLIKGLRAAIAALLYLTNLVILFLPLAVVGALYCLVPLKACKKACLGHMQRLYICWININYFIQTVTTSIQWEIKGLNQLTPKEWYLLIANHQSWADILVLQCVCRQKIPPLKFFLKKELLWTLPFASWACWLLGFPFIHRYGKKVLAKHPELKRKNIETTKRACLRFRHVPTTVASFIEGTRFHEKKRQRQQSPYRYLLRPKATGVAFSLSVLGDFFHNILNVTIIYPQKKASLWHFLSGDIPKIIVDIQAIPITSDWRGDYPHDRQFRTAFQKKLNDLWKQKDARMTEVYADYTLRNSL